MANETIAVEIRAGIATLTLQRPHHLNALTEPMLSEMGIALRELEPDPAVRVLVITGSGRGFCAGQDLKEYLDKGPGHDAAQHLKHFYLPVIQTLVHFSKPTMAMVNGVAAGAGMSLALACDLILAAADARFVQSFVGIGLVPDSGSSFFLTRRLGTARALELTLLGEALDSAVAERWGLINRVVASEELAAQTYGWARQLADGPPLALTMTKALVYQAMQGDLERALDREAGAQARASQTADHQAALTAFVQKAPRPPFHGV